MSAGPGRRIAVVGGGLAGLVAADRLLSAGHSVVVFEKYPEAGGLVGTFSVGGEALERFYHHLFTSDVDYVSPRRRARPGRRDRVAPVEDGLLLGWTLYPFGTPVSLLGFSPLGVKGRLELVLSTLRLRQMRDWRALEGETAVGWLKTCAPPSDASSRRSSPASLPAGGSCARPAP
ncbi:MAG: NAD(P)-binding protein [Holophagales bacterium]|nr:NAD(P)-binding protein [Holophagales bacterium]